MDEAKQPFLWFLVMAIIQDGQQHVQIENWHTFMAGCFLWLVTLTPFLILELWQQSLWFLIMAVIQNGWQHDNWSKMATQCLSTTIGVLNFSDFFSFLMFDYSTKVILFLLYMSTNFRNCKQITDWKQLSNSTSYFAISTDRKIHNFMHTFIFCYYLATFPNTYSVR